MNYKDSYIIYNHEKGKLEISTEDKNSPFAIYNFSNQVGEYTFIGDKKSSIKRGYFGGYFSPLCRIVSGLTSKNPQARIIESGKIKIENNELKIIEPMRIAFE